MRVFYTNSTTILRTIMLLAAILLTNPANAQVSFVGGDGTPSSPYQVRTPEQLQAIKDGLDKHYKLIDNIVLTEVWTPIVSTLASPFTGTIDGDGYTISNLEIDNDKDGGFISYNNGTLKNLGLKLGNNGIKSTGAIGAIAAWNGEKGKIQNCYVEGISISCKLTNNSSYAGGICGHNKGTIENCFVQVKTIDINNSSTYLHKAGGIAGYQDAGTIKYCISFVGAIKHLDKDRKPTPGYLNYIAGSQYGTCTSIGNYVSYKTVITYPVRYDNLAISDKGTLWLGRLSNDHVAWSYSGNTLTLNTMDGSKSFSFNNLEVHTYLDGEGTMENPFKIDNAADLNKLSEYTNNGFYSDTSCYVLTANIDLENVPFTPIASGIVSQGNIKQFQPFKGHFDGQGHSIKNLTVNSSTGLFALIQNATIQNVALIDCQIKSLAYNNSSYKSPNYSERTVVGTLVGADNGYSTSEGKSVISNCYVTGSIQVDALNEKSISVGGIIGQLKLNSELTSCFSDVVITMNKPAEGGTGAVAIGGIVGVLGGTVQNCFAKGSILSTAYTLKSWNSIYAGSIVGHLDHSTYNNSWGEVNSCIALSANIESTSENGIEYKHIVSRIGTRNADKKKIELAKYANYGRQKVSLKLNGTDFPFEEDLAEYAAIPGANPIVFFAEDGTDWNGELPSADAWEKTVAGYVNLKSIATTFRLKEQIKLGDYIPFDITIDEMIAHGAITVVPEKKVFAGDTVKLTITPDLGYCLKPNSLKVTGAITDTVKIDMTDSSFVMPAQAVALSAEFVLDSLRLAEITTGDSLLISQTDAGWFYQIKNEVTTKSLSTDTNIPFNGIISGALPADKILSIEPDCNGELVFNDVTVPTLIIKQGANILLNSTSKLTYTDITNDGGSFVAREGATITNTATGQVKMHKLTFTTPQSGTLAVRVGDVAIASGDMLAVDTKFSVTATPASGYQTESLSVKTASGDVTATSGLYAMPDAEVTVSATFKYTYVPPVPTYYTVTLPKVEGAVTNPQAGEYLREEGYSFSFSLKLEAGYEQSVPVVTANGVVLTARASDGKYIIKSIIADTQIKIDGVVRDNPTGNAEIENDAIRVRGSVGALLISTPHPSSLEIYSISGNRLRHLDISAGDSQIQLPAELYIIRVDDHRQKVFIR